MAGIGWILQRGEKANGSAAFTEPRK